MDPAQHLSSAALARLAIANEVDLWAGAASTMADGASGRSEAVAWFSSGIPVAFFNQVFAIGDRPDPAAIADAVEILRDRRVPFYVRIRAGLDDALVPALVELGLREDPEEAYPAMAMAPIPADVAGDTLDGIEIRRAADVDVLGDHVAVVAAAFGLPLEIAHQLLPAAELDLPGVVVYAGYLDGRPVSASLGFTRDGTVGVYNVATLAEVRGQGLGGGLTRHAMAEGRARGATVAILQSSAMGRPLYASMGFREVLSFRVFGTGG